MVSLSQLLLVYLDHVESIYVHPSTFPVSTAGSTYPARTLVSHNVRAVKILLSQQTNSRLEESE